MGCYENLKDEFLKSLSEKDIKDVLDDLKNMREKMGLQDSTISIKDRLAEYANAQSEAKRMAAQEAERAALINATVYREAVTKINVIKNSPRATAFDGIMAMTTGVEKDVPHGRESIENTGNAKIARMQSDIVKAIKAVGRTTKEFRQLQKDPSFQKNFTVELDAIGKAEGKATKAVTSDPDAFDYAKIYSEQIEKLRVMLNDAGANIPKIKGYIPQWWGGTFVRALGKTQADARKGFYDLVINHLDHEKTFGNDDPVKYIDSAYDGITTGHHGLEHQWGTGREFIFKSPEDWLAVNKEIGAYKDPIHAINQYLIGGYKNLALMEKLGTNPENMFNRIIREYSSSERKSEVTDLNARRKHMLKLGFDGVNGRLNESIVPKMSMIANWLVKLNNIVHLGMVTASSFNDIPVSALNLMHNGVGFLDAYYQIFKGLGKSLAGRADKDLITRLLGEGADGTRGSAIARHSSISQTSGLMSKGMTLFSKLSLIDPWTDAVRGINGQALASHLAHQMNDTWATMDKSIQNILTRYGIFEKDWNIIKQAKTELLKGKEYITPDAIRDIPKEAFKDMGAREIAKYKNDLEDKLQSVFTSEIHYGVITPGLGERAGAFSIFGMPMTMPPRGTTWGEVVHLLMQFKWYPLTVSTKVWPRLREQGMPAYIHYAVMGTLFGYMTIAAKDMLQGKTPPDPRYANTWIRAMAAGLAFSIFGDAFLDQFGKPMQGIGQRLAGPTLGLGGDLYKILDNAVHGEVKKAGMEAVKTGMRNLPFANLWFLNAANNYLFNYYIQEVLNPGHVQKMQEDLEKSTGSHLFWEASEYANLPR